MGAFFCLAKTKQAIKCPGFHFAGITVNLERFVGAQKDPSLCQLHQFSNVWKGQTIVDYVEI